MTTSSNGHKSPERGPAFITASGWARSGKGTSMRHLRDHLEGIGRSVVLIDQGIKFRAIGLVAAQAGKDPLAGDFDGFIASDSTHDTILDLLRDVAKMTEAEKEALLYTQEMARVASQVGQVARVHDVAIELLRSEVDRAAMAKTEVVIVDGRSVEQLTKGFQADGVGFNVMNWFFKCDPVIAARRSLGIFAPNEELDTLESQLLLKEAVSISDRNRTDMLRPTMPLVEPPKAHHLDLLRYSQGELPTPYGISRLVLRNHQNPAAVVDTSFTSTIEQMTNPVTAITCAGLFHHGVLSHRDIGLGVLN